MSPAWAPAFLPPPGPAGMRPSASPSRARPGGVTSPGARSSVPELPEVETIVREIAPLLEGSRIARAELRKTDVLRELSKPHLLKTLQGNTIEQSEEHTSELQSPCNLVCRLLLEKKKQISGIHIAYWDDGLN